MPRGQDGMQNKLKMRRLRTVLLIIGGFILGAEIGQSIGIAAFGGGMNAAIPLGLFCGYLGFQLGRSLGHR